MQLRLSSALLWTGGYLGLLVLCTLLDVAVWRKLFPNHAHIANLRMQGLGFLVFAALLKKSGFEFRLLESVSWQGVLLALACAFMFYLLLDKGLDPLLDRLFPHSSQSYEESIASLRAHPAISLIHVCFLAPVMEETLTRGVLLGGLQTGYGWPVALAVSTAVFAALHFNLVQTLSALACGLVLGLLYLHTGSLLCCMLAHAVYNCISCFAILRPLHH